MIASAGPIMICFKVGHILIFWPSKCRCKAILSDLTSLIPAEVQHKRMSEEAASMQPIPILEIDEHIDLIPGFAMDYSMHSLLQIELKTILISTVT
jgi:hypothetical protein